jgi:hypothetical protein
MFILNGKPLALDRAFTTADGTQYPRNWLRLATPQQREAIGITEQADPPSWDQRYFWGYDENGDLIPKQLEDEIITVWEDVTTEVGIASTSRTYTQTGLKTLHISQTKQTANTLLAPTDWYVVRKFERDVEIPVGIASYRASVIDVSEQRETLISNVTTVDELKGLYEASSEEVETVVDGEPVIEFVSVPPAMPEWPSI